MTSRERRSGTLISVDLAAYLFRLRLLTLRAEVRVAPAPVDIVEGAAMPRSAPLVLRRPPGNGLVDAARAIRAGERDLQLARELQQPAAGRSRP